MPSAFDRIRTQRVSRLARVTLQVLLYLHQYGQVSSQSFPWRPIVAILIHLRARSSVSLRSGGSILQSGGGPFFASGEDRDAQFDRFQQNIDQTGAGLRKMVGIERPQE